MKPITPGPGQESVWDYPRPPRVEATERHIEVRVGDTALVDSRHAKRVLETSHPPIYYVPKSDIEMSILRPNSHRTFCEFKGVATYVDLVNGERVVPNVAWVYEDPTPAFSAIAGHLAFYPSRVDACFVDGEAVVPQPGDFYGGWVTKDIVGPFKGAPGTMGW